MKLKRSKREKEVQHVPSPVEQKSPKLYLGPDVPTLHLECWEEELSPSQLEAYKQADDEHNNIQSKLDDIVQKSGGEVIYTGAGDKYAAYTVSGKAPGLTELAAKNAHLLESSKKDKKKRKEKENRYIPTPPPPSPPPPEPPAAKVSKKSRADRLADRSEKVTKSKTSTPQNTLTNVQSVSSGVRPSEASAIGGLATGNKNAIVDLTKDDTKNAPDSKEVAFNKLQGKTFPSLVVVARPYLRIKEGAGNSDRATLDSKVKSVLMHTPTKFTEWLIQQGLVRSEQTCAIHLGTKLKLGMYSDVSKFPYSGGYVWISECCPTRFVSVFSGSLFEGATHPPSVLLKLIYHWACQTNVQNVVQWVKVDNLYVKGLFTWLRSICTSGLHQHMNIMGGPGKRIEVGVISLGTTSHDGQQRQVKVEVLGILDSDAKMVRLRAVEPLADGERNYKKRFLKILDPLLQWVHTDSTILTDLTVDKSTLYSMGYKTVHQVSSTDSTSKHSNANIMEYLRRIVPRMFQNTLSLLSRQIIQQFLDELVWRECYGTSPGQAFDSIVAHIGEQTRLEAKDSLVVRMNKISLNPFKNWKYSNIKPPKAGAHAPPPAVEETVKETLGRGRRKRKITPSPDPPSPASPPSRKNSHTTSNSAARNRKRISYIEDDDDDEISLLERAKRAKKRLLEEPPLKKEIKVKDFKQKKIKEEPKVKETKRSKDDKVEKKKEKKQEIKLTIKKEPREEQSVDLEGYYFGQLEGEINHNMKNRQMLVQCTECSLEFDNNANLQLHLFAHANPDTTADAGSDTEATQCRYCLQHYRAPEALEGHLLQFHPLDTKAPGLYTYACLLCETRFTSVQTLSNHMQKTHVHLELPYICGICGYRASSHRVCIDHFHSNHQDSASLQCPYCLKIVRVFADGCDLQSNVEHFLNHLVKHQDQAATLKCNRCALRFVHLGALKEHQVRHHLSIFGARPLCSQGHLIAKPKNKATPPVKDSTNHVILETFDDLTIVVPDGMICKECDYQMEDETHYVGTFKCAKCPYQTSCWRTLLLHSGICQLNKPQELNAPLTSTWHCICSFSTDDGNVLAHHLNQCERKSAYPTEEEAKLNTIPTTSTKHGMMDSLGLQRNKEPETEESQPQPEAIPDYPEPPSVLNTQLSLDDLAPPSVLQADQMELEQLKNEPYEQPLATPQVQHEEMDVANSCMAGDISIPDIPTSQSESLSTNQAESLDSYIDGAAFQPLPDEPMPQPEFEPL